jgi:hypothetical protein
MSKFHLLIVEFTSPTVRRDPPPYLSSHVASCVSLEKAYPAHPYERWRHAAHNSGSVRIYGRDRQGAGATSALAAGSRADAPGGRGGSRASVNPRDWKCGLISRADVADFLVKQIGDDAFLHKTPVLTS